MASEYALREPPTKPLPSVFSSELAPVMRTSRLQVPLTSSRRCSSVEPPAAQRARFHKPLRTWVLALTARQTERTNSSVSKSSRVTSPRLSSFSVTLSATAPLTPTSSNLSRKRSARSTKAAASATWRPLLRTFTSTFTEKT